MFIISRTNVLFIKPFIALNCGEVVGDCLVVEQYIRRCFSIEIHDFERKMPELFTFFYVVWMSD